MMRYFVNQYKDIPSGVKAKINQSRWLEAVDSTAALIAREVSSRSLSQCDGGLYVGSPGIAYMFYYLARQAPLASKRQEYLQKANEYMDTGLSYCEKKRNRDPSVSFLLGGAGMYAVGSLIGREIGDQPLSDKLAARYASLAEQCKPVNFSPNGSDELFVGRAGYLCGTLLMERELRRPVVPSSDIHALCSAMVQSGKGYARKVKSQSPLMFAYHGTEYLGAAHGLSSILQMLLSFPDFLAANPTAEMDIHQAVDFMLSLEQPDFNYAPAMDEVQGKYKPTEREQLVHWCHGAPGIVYLFARAYKVWGEEKYLQACLRCGEITWQRGLLKKGPGICHGVGGNGYVFLLLYRLTGDQKYLHRASCFAEFMFTQEFQTGARTPDSPYSLFEGWAGTACFFADLLQPEKAEFPFFNVVF